MAVSLNRKIFVGFTAVLVVLGLICGVTIVDVTDIALQSPLAAQSRELLAGLERLWRLSATADAAVHRYVLTGDPEALRAFRGSRMEIQENLVSLRQVANEDTSQPLRLTALETAVKARLAAADEVLAMSAGANRQAAQTALAKNGPLLDESVRTPIKRMITVERTALARKVGRTAVIWFLTMAGIVLACMISMFAVAWAGLLIRREVRQRDALEQEEREAKALLERVMDGCGAAVYAKDREGRILTVNRYAASLFGRNPAALIGHTVAEVFPQEVASVLEENNRKVIESGTPMEFEELVPGDGGMRTFFSIEYPLFDKTGAVSGFCGVSTDITARKQTEAALAAAKEAAEQASQFKDQFLSTMSHELRTPLNAVLGFSEMLTEQRYGPLNERQADYVQLIHNAGQHLLRLINDILDLSKIEAGRLDLVLEDLLLDHIAGDVLSSLKPLADKKSINLTRSCPSDVTVRADSTRLQQVLTNLVANAIKFSPEGSGVSIIAARQGAWVRIDVVDNGPGIPFDEQKLIFDSFYRAKQSRSREGAGLGLAITKKLVETHGGEFSLESEPGRGSRFFFTLPSGKPTPEPIPWPCQATSERGTILVVEDDEATAVLIERQLQSEGYGVYWCEDPRRAVDVAAQMLPSAITLDVIMKPITGWEVLAQLKAGSSTADIPVILMSVIDQRPVAALLGAYDYLVKPVEKAALLSSLSRCLGKRELRSDPVPLLVVDDDRAVRETIQRLLADLNYTVRVAEDGAQAEAAIASKRPEIVVLDLMLPDADGFELLERWRANPHTATMDILVLTSKDLSAVEAQWLGEKADGLFTKSAVWRGSLVEVLGQSIVNAAERRHREATTSVG